MSKFKVGDKVICKSQFAERYKVPGTGIPGTVVRLHKFAGKDYCSVNLDTDSKNLNYFVCQDHFEFFKGNAPFKANDLVEIVSSDYRSIKKGDIRIVKRIGPKNSVIVYNTVNTKPLLFHQNEVKLYKRIF